MNRVVFVVLYPAAVYFSFLFGSPWLYWGFVLSNTGKITAAISLPLIASTAAPIFLLSVAYFRGRSSGKRKLILLPLFAFFASATAFIHLQIAKQVVGGVATSQSGPFGLNAAIYFALFSMYAPLLLHLACLVAGVIGSKPKGLAMNGNSFEPNNTLQRTLRDKAPRP